MSPESKGTVNKQINDIDMEKKEVTIKMQLEITLNVDSDYDTENLKNLASLIVSDNLECQLDTSYDNETFVNFNISNVEEVE